MDPRSEWPTQLADAASDDDSDLPFPMLGRYRLLERIGSGGMGEVFRAYEAALDRIVALKVLPTEFAGDQEFVRRFYTEAAAAARLSHPHVVEIYYIGEEAGHHYYAMQYVPGESLAGLLGREGRLQWSSAVAIAEQVLAGLAAAHSVGLVHRDVKPGNILIDKSGRALLADFGLVKSLQDSEGLTAAGMIMGTLDYIAPEQGRGQPLDGRADLYSLGVVLYQVLSGRLPYTADSPTAMIFQHIYESPEPLERAAPGIPAPLAAIVARLMAKRPENRYPDAESVVADLRALCAGRCLPSGADLLTEYRAESEAGDGPGWNLIPGSASNDAPAANSSQIDALPSLDLDRIAPRRWGPRLREWIADFIAVRSPKPGAELQNMLHRIEHALAEYERRYSRLRELAVEVESAIAQLRTQRTEWSEEARQQAPLRGRGAPAESATRLLGSKSFAERQVRELAELIAVQSKEFCLIQQRLGRLAQDIRQLRRRRDLLRARSHPVRARAAPRWVPVGAAVGLIVAATVLGVAALRWTSQQTNSEMPSENVLRSSGPLSDAPMRAFETRTGPVVALEFTSDGRLLCAATTEGLLQLWDPSTGALLDAFSTSVPRNGLIALDADERVAATTAQTDEGGTELTVWDQAGKRIRAVTPPGSAVRALDLSPGGGTLAAIVLHNGRSRVELHGTGTPERIDEFQLPAADFRRVTFTPDGRLVLVRGRGRAAVWEPGKSQMLELDADSSGEIVSTAISPDGTLLAGGYSSGTTVLWNLDTGARFAESNGSFGPVHAMAFSSGSRQLAVATREGVHLWDLNLGYLRKTLPTADASAVAFGPDGSVLAVGDPAGRIELWDVAPEVLRLEKQLLDRASASLSDARFEQLKQARKDLTASAMTPDGRLAAFGDRSGAVSFWQVEGGKQLSYWLSGTQSKGYAVLDLAFSPDGRFLAVSGGARRSAQILDVESWWPLHDLGPSAQAVAFSPNGRFVATGRWERDQGTGVLRIWDAQSGEEARTIVGHVHYVYDLAFSPDGEYLLSGGSRSMHVWEVESGQETRRITPFAGSARHIGFSRDGRHALAASGRKGSIYDVRTGNELLRFEDGSLPEGFDSQSLIGDRGILVRFFDPPSPATSAQE